MAPPATSASTRTARPSASNYVTEVQKAADGSLQNNVISKADNVDQTLGLGKDSPYLAQPVSRDFPSCP